MLTASDAVGLAPEPLPVVARCIVEVFRKKLFLAQLEAVSLYLDGHGDVIFDIYVGRENRRPFDKRQMYEQIGCTNFFKSKTVVKRAVNVGKEQQSLKLFVFCKVDCFFHQF